MKIHFKLTFTGELVTLLLEYNCFDSFFKIIFVEDITVWMLLLILTPWFPWILLWVLPKNTATLKL